MPNPQSEYLKGLFENDFSRQYLIPLYQKMGFRDVEFYGGGTLELGKDLTMWAPDLGDERRNYSVVVKRGDLKGAVSGSNSAGEVATQVRQCFATGFKDKLTNAQREIHFCYIVASGSISKETRQSLESQLKDFWNYITCFGGDDILGLLREYGITIGITAQLHDLQATLAETVTDSDISVSVSNKQTAIKVAPKPGSPPLRLGLKIKVDQSEEGELLHQQLKKFWDQGGSIPVSQ